MNSYARTCLAVFLGAATVGTVMGAGAAQPQSATSQGRTAGGQADQPVSVEELKKSLEKPTTVTATVAAIDYDSRVVVLRDEKGIDHALYVGDDVKRFNNVKVGDELKVTYYMSVASRILAPGESGGPRSSEGVVSAPGDRPGGTASAQESRVVTVTAVDPKAQTVSFTTEKGEPFTLRVEDKSRLEKVKPGDRVEIVFTAAALVNMEPAK